MACIAGRECLLCGIVLEAPQSRSKGSATMTESESRLRNDRGVPQPPAAEAARRLAAVEIARLASLGDDALHEEMDRNWLAPADPEVYSIWMRLYELGLGDVF